MQVTLKYFGMLVEATSVTEEQLEIASCSVSDLMTRVKKQYPKLKDQNFKVAINNELVNGDYLINDNLEVALLPPFAGG